MSVRFFTQRILGALGRLERYGVVAGGTAEAFDRDLAVASTAFGFFDETRVLCSAIARREYDRRGLGLMFRRLAPTTALRFAQGLPFNQAGYSLGDLAAAFGESMPARTDPVTAIMASDYGSLLPPQSTLWGGLASFQWGGAGAISRHDGLDLFRQPPFPLPGLDGPEVLETVRFHHGTTDRGEIASRDVIRRDPDRGSVRQRGYRIVVPHGSDAAVFTRWDLEELSPTLSADLDPEMPVIVYGPGRLLEGTGFSGRLEDFPIGLIVGLVQAVEGQLEGIAEGGRTIMATIERIGGPPVRLEYSAGGQNAAGLPLRWRLRLGSDRGQEVSSIRLDWDDRAAVGNYLANRRLDLLKFALAERSRSVRLREGLSQAPAEAN